MQEKPMSEGGVMQISTAAAAAVLAAEINAVVTKISQVQAAIDGNCIITGGSLTFNDANGNPSGQIIQPLTLAESQTVFTTMINMLNARNSAWSAALAAM